MDSSNHFWNQLLQLTEMSEAAPIDEVCAALLGIEEGFSGSVDPADEFEKYVAISLCRQMRQVLERKAG
tara:strand:+ start:303 stop:509 length:207 start_codon:yes stop_codon:yes gene_type:complete